ncbi:hypothetical protein [Clostridium sp.]|uniref:hypothetical protein n=1 Tax=Clostridium sp. TaxID=1506 RepID=UPI003F4BE6D3
MKMCSSSLFYDNEDHKWRFYVNDNMELMYSIMYDEDKWTKENKIDNEVLDFTVSFNRDNKIYIIYSVKAGLLKYCIWDQNKWFGKTIYSFDNPDYEMTELNVITIGDLMHVFFIGKNNIKKSQCTLMHFSLNKDENLVNTIDTIPFLQEAFNHYQVHHLKNGNLSLIYAKRDEKEAAINLTQYNSNKWSIPRRLYGITGNSINFCTLLRLDKINIMNVSKEGSVHLLEHVLVEPDGTMRSNKIHESYNNPSNFLLVEISGALFAIWTEGKDILASSYKNKWSEPFKFYSELKDNEILIYKYLSLSNKYNNLNCKYILGTSAPEIKLLLPNPRIKDGRGDSLETSKGKVTSGVEPEAEKNKLSKQGELLVLQKNNKVLEKKLIDLQIKYQQKVRVPEESDDSFIKLTNLRRKAEEKLNIITEIHQVTIKELQRFKADKISKDLLINEIKAKLEQLTYEYEGLKKQKISKDNTVNELKNQLQRLSIENEKLSQELKYEKNIGIVDRILKKKPER